MDGVGVSSASISCLRLVLAIIMIMVRALHYDVGGDCNEYLVRGWF